MPTRNDRTTTDKVTRAKRAVKDFDQKTRPVVRQIVDFAQQGVTQAGAALRVAGANIDKIADAAVDLASAQIDLAAPPRPTERRPRTKRG
jgi:hypothetical protein